MVMGACTRAATALAISNRSWTSSLELGGDSSGSAAAAANIATELSLSLNTVRTHCQAAYRKPPSPATCSV